jgi:dephospho-CoA kinase
MDRPLRVALTGGIATGKSYCAARFRSTGVPVIDADAAARDAVQPGTPGLAAIVDRFGAGILTAANALDRSALARLVFADERARLDLEAIVHPRVYQTIREWFAALDSTPAPPALAVAEIPLLFETGHAGDFDVVVVAACPAPLQLERLMSRDGMTEADARRRLASQWPIHEKVARADVVIDTSGTFAETDRQVDDACRRLSARAARQP